jgi:hypothetical protein
VGISMDCPEKTLTKVLGYAMDMAFEYLYKKIANFIDFMRNISYNRYSKYLALPPNALGGERQTHGNNRRSGSKSKP